MASAGGFCNALIWRRARVQVIGGQKKDAYLLFFTKVCA
jgi:hypothetical protein